MTTPSEILHKIRQSIVSGDRSNISDLVSRAQRISVTDYHVVVEIAILLRDNGHFDQSAFMCNEVLRNDENHVAALYELSILQAMQGRHVEALLGLERILVSCPADERSLRFAARMSARIGDYAAARRYIYRADETCPAHPDIPWLRDLIGYMEAFPAGVADRLTQLYERDRLSTTAETIVSWASASLQRREGFSLIRLGDGEGAFCRISSDDERQYPHIYEHCRQDRARVWFNNEIDIHQSGFTETAFTLRDAIQNANVVGMPYRNWVEHEYKFCSPTGIVGLINALRVAQLPSVKRSQSWTSQLVHMDLLQKGILGNLLREHRRVSLISCLSGAAEAIRTHFELEEVTLYRIPGEKLHAAQLGAETTVGRHYPERYNELMEELAKPLHGQLFLVAGGLLGKLYCNRIKISGGVALDIGSVVDNWMGKATRPDNDPRHAL